VLWTAAWRLKKRCAELADLNRCWHAAKDVYNPPIYSQAVKVSGAQTSFILPGRLPILRTVARRIPAASKYKLQPRRNV